MSLADLLYPLYPSSRLHQLTRIQRRRVRTGSSNRPKLPTNCKNDLEVVLYKKPGNTTRRENLRGLLADSIASFFTDLFTHQDDSKREESIKLVTDLVNNDLSMVIAIVSRNMDLSFTLIACVIFHPDNAEGSYIPFIGVLDQNVGNAFN